MSLFAGFNPVQVIERIDWTPEQFSLRVSGAELPFSAGQFTKLGLEDDAGNLVSRAYSLVNAPGATADEHEFLIVAHPQGKLSPRLQSLSAGDTVWMGNSAYGDLIQPSIPEFTQDLWLLATGTGIGPFLSLLADQRLTQPNIVLVHGVRYGRDRVYRDDIQTLVEQYQGRLRYHTVVSREALSDAMSGRIPALIDSGELQTVSELELAPEHSFVMMCGNPDMIKDTASTLRDKGLPPFRQATGGNYIHERYW
ncbi:ferredoxin--NADP reductase [Vibrio fluvialis]|uniref:ferredoxin--NADP reductase n=1 Tax=Vibrio fluvialis TaxID=676 RepID=UPI00192CAE7F|nr:ferredoxin--NADP reductase [Vibrio fluvialis]EKO3990778.1 ferredoxin--NADP reductase [Vibrio fluvialis]ELI5733474.1 ferredoxin--NADP reductase [Vibrio fluvialis]MBL4239234.1 ferredoxin--NADP reductase [Vibrio fluvialis]MBL4265626.1 ferredoxin--NADP reductase [Vibrio fluvialis]MBL4270722.1 ferredoxin--NADP reductase [Vibrio fluvialis]